MVCHLAHGMFLDHRVCKSTISECECVDLPCKKASTSLLLVQIGLLLALFMG